MRNLVPGLALAFALLLPSVAHSDAIEPATCQSTRSERLAAAQSVASSYRDWLKRTMPHAKAIVASCKVKDRVTIGASLFDVRHQDDVTCKSALPAGVSKQDAYALLLDVDPASHWTDGYIDQDDGFIVSDTTCGQDDAKAGPQPHIRFSDTDALKALLAWKKP